MSAVTGRFAPSPSGRLHLGNLACSLLAWLSAKSQGGRIVLRIEDLDAERCPRIYADLLEQDLAWLGLVWDEGGSTLGNLLGRQILMPMVDIGVGQLAMHSAMETASCKDAEYLANACAAYYNTPIFQPEDGQWKLGL